VEIPFERGLDGWSDADVLTHAVIDALLGAAALGDIGRHFPPGDPQYRGVSSLELLGSVKDRLAAAGFAAANIDATVVAEQPRLREYIDGMRQGLAGALGMDIGRVSVKASTANGVGAMGRGEGIAAYAAAMIEGGENEGI